MNVRFVWILVAGLLAVAPAAAKTVVYRNGEIITVDAGFTIAKAMAVRDDRILAVGPEREVLAAAGPGAEIVDLEGRAVIPGLIDNHIHAIRAAVTWADEVRLDGVRTRAEALARIRARAAAIPKGWWIYTLGGFSEEQFEDDPSMFTRAELDKVAPDHPVYLQHMFNHATVNSAAARVAGLDNDFLAIVSGELPQGPDNRLIGPVGGRTMERVRNLLPKVAADGAKASAMAITRDLAKVGLTSVFDMGGFGIRDEDYAPFQALAEAGDLPVRVFYTRWFRNDDGPRGRGAFEREIATLKPFSGPPHFKLLGAGELIHIAFQDSVFRPGSTQPAHLARFEEILRALAKAGWPMRIHAENDATIARHLDIIDRIAKDVPLKHLRWTFEHADGISRRSLERMKAHGMMAALHSRPVITGLGMQQAVGERGLELPPLRLVQESGVPWGLGTDAMMVNGYDPFLTLWWATTGKALSGALVTGQQLTREEALIAHTRANAYLLFAEKELGSLEPGKLADFVVLSENYMTVPEDRIRDIRPVVTVVGGRVVYDARSRS